jgi:hypothetical protein
MGGLDSAAAVAVTTAARLVADAYMAAPAVGPVSFMDLYGLCRMNLYGLDLNLWLLINDTRVYLYLCISE